MVVRPARSSGLIFIGHWLPEDLSPGLSPPSAAHAITMSEMRVCERPI